MPTEERTQYLIQRYLSDELSGQELDEFLDWVASGSGEETLKTSIDASFASGDWPGVEDDSRRHTLFHHVTKKGHIDINGGQPRPIVRPLYRTLRVAAVVLLLLSAASVTWYLLQNNHRQEKLAVSPTSPNAPVISPGGNKATLTLADGQVIILDTAANGTLANQGNVKVSKLANGQLLYKIEGTATGQQVPVWQTLSTPKGGQYKVVLPDGSTAVLNAASSLKFPSYFSGKERQVSVTGEVYFEVASKQGTHPFIVSVNNRQGHPLANVTVLGTDFNVMAYDEEGYWATTLLNGAVKVKTPSKETKLKPGQQLQISNASKREQVLEGKDEQAVAWVKGYFHFDKADIHAVMRQLERWYNITVEYEAAPVKKFSGTIPRGVNATEVLKMLELTNNVHFSIEGTVIKVNN
ncbi:FecR family protein [Filimonas effusa]|uniref:FecR family protein n=1 Tax=Filimonas effusa TaxID=2508721 RepID=A0A4Q1D526_9BACT|nr:FecR family protein [Filimonas effusa]RXK83612.1 FecR family protein [Filimonas effusa]